MDKRVGIVGMSEYATGKLGDIVFIQLPEVGSKVSQDGKSIGKSEEYFV